MLTSERINGLRAKHSGKTMRERVPPLQNSKNPHAKRAAKPRTFAALFWSFGSVRFGGKPDAASAAQGVCQEQGEAERRHNKNIAKGAAGTT